MPQNADIVRLDAHRPVELKAPPKRSRRRLFQVVMLALVVTGVSIIIWRGIEANRAARVAIDELTALTNNQGLIDSVIAQNASTHKLALAEISALDSQYRADVKISGGMTAQLMARPQSLFLKDYVTGAQDRIVFIMLMDSKGLNVAVSRPTTDYYQGDEAKWQKTFPMGAGAVHWGGRERDYVTNRVMHVVSRTIIDPKTGDSIGALAMAFDAAALKR